MPDKKVYVSPVAIASVTKKCPIRNFLTLFGRWVNVANILAHAIVPSISPSVIWFFLFAYSLEEPPRYPNVEADNFMK
jgi:hypothetical protein